MLFRSHAIPNVHARAPLAVWLSLWEHHPGTRPIGISFIGDQPRHRYQAQADRWIRALMPFDNSIQNLPRAKRTADCREFQSMFARVLLHPITRIVWDLYTLLERVNSNMHELPETFTQPYGIFNRFPDCIWPYGNSIDAEDDANYVRVLTFFIAIRLPRPCLELLCAWARWYWYAHGKGKSPYNRLNALSMSLCPSSFPPELWAIVSVPHENLSNTKPSNVRSSDRCHSRSRPYPAPETRFRHSRKCLIDRVAKDN